jgi:hypothetical protein
MNALTLVRMRREAEREGYVRSEKQLRVLSNGLVYGQPARFDAYGKKGIRPGPWCFPPIAATVAAGCRCLLAMLAHCGEIDWAIAHRDTDGALIAAPRLSEVLEALRAGRLASDRRKDFGVGPGDRPGRHNRSRVPTRDRGSAWSGTARMAMV